MMTFCKTILLVVVVVLGLSVSPAFAHATAKPRPTTTASALTKKTQGQAETAAAKALVEEVIGTNPNRFPSPDLLTNRSAALMGILIFIPLAFLDSFSTIGTAKEQAQGKEVDKTIQALGKKYSLDQVSDADHQNNAAKERLDRQGRAFLDDVIAAISEVAREMPGEGAAKPSHENAPATQFPRDIRDYVFTPLSPTKVGIRVKGPLAQAMKNVPLAAILQDGQWRLDFGGISDLNKMILSQADIRETNFRSENAPLLTAPESLFQSQPSSEATETGAPIIEFSDGYRWSVADKISAMRKGTTDKGRALEAWLGAKADYYHILHTDLVAVRPHQSDQSEPNAPQAQ